MAYDNKELALKTYYGRAQQPNTNHCEAAKNK